MFGNKEALSEHKPVYSNADQISQFSSNNYLSELKKNQVQISMDGKGRCMNSIMIERLWRSLKYEDIPQELRSGFRFETRLIRVF